MALHNDPVYNLLRRVHSRVYYMGNDSDNTLESNKLPYIVLQIISKRPITGDNEILLYSITYQITIVTRRRNEGLIYKFQSFFNGREFIPTLVSSYSNEDYTMSRVYHVNLLSKGGY